MSHGAGSKVYDVDGTEYVDMHGGYGASIAGHAHPAIVAAVSRPGAARHPFRPADRGRDLGRGRARPPVRPAAVALRQLRHRGDDGRRAPDARAHRPRPDHQGRGLLPRPPRLGAGVGAARRRTRSARATTRSASPATPASRRRSATSSSSSRSTTSARSSGCSPRTHGRVAGMILEPIMMNAGIIPPEPGYLAGLARPAAPARRAARPSTRSRPASRPARAARRRATASSRTSSAWPRRSAAASRSPRSAAPSR